MIQWYSHNTVYSIPYTEHAYLIISLSVSPAYVQGLLHDNDPRVQEAPAFAVSGCPAYVNNDWESRRSKIPVIPSYITYMSGYM